MRFWSAVGWAHSIFFRAFLVVFPCNFSSLHIHPRSSRNFLPFTFERWGVTKEKKRKEKKRLDHREESKWELPRNMCRIVALECGGNTCSCLSH